MKASEVIPETEKSAEKFKSVVTVAPASFKAFIAALLLARSVAEVMVPFTSKLLACANKFAASVLEVKVLARVEPFHRPLLTNSEYVPLI